MNRTATAALLLSAAVLLPGCALNIGGTTTTDFDVERLDRLEQRIEEMEGRLGTDEDMEEIEIEIEAGPGVDVVEIKR